jgi:hypothetical protein
VNVSLGNSHLNAQESLVILGSKISGQENTQPLKVDTMAKDKEQMTNNDLRNTTKKAKE